MDALWWIVGFLIPMLLAPLRAEFDWAGAAFGRWVGFAVADVWWGLRLIWIAYSRPHKVPSRRIRALEHRVDEALRYDFGPLSNCACGFCRNNRAGQ